MISQVLVPENEIHITFARSGGAGGQNVNKVSSKVAVHWRVGASRVFTDEEKMRIRAKLANRLNYADEIVISADEERSQPQNRALAIQRLRALVASAIRVPKLRRPTRPTKSSKIKKLESKKKHSILKKRRRVIWDW
ncbi:MAG TPA: alternative ribosome rescue aminoacyl-tRNA hydrolase ArfB [Candidatus Magasanikbacteria bacterium]|nr:alternative ribosome rescue aminoacyl-tRNA hydrolase ArfB [Candidatus Magasanikbacteria bacterium]